jgi:hypothetical protein
LVFIKGNKIQVAVGDYCNSIGNHGYDNKVVAINSSACVRVYQYYECMQRMEQFDGGDFQEIKGQMSKEVTSISGCGYRGGNCK